MDLTLCCHCISVLVGREGVGTGNRRSVLEGTMLVARKGVCSGGAICSAGGLKSFVLEWVLYRWGGKVLL